MTEPDPAGRKPTEAQESQHYSLEFSYENKVTSVNIWQEDLVEYRMYNPNEVLVPFRGEFFYVDKYGRGIERIFRFYMPQKIAGVEKEVVAKAQIAFHGAYSRADEYFAADRDEK